MSRRLVTTLFILALITLLPWWSRGLAVGLVALWWAAHIPIVARGLWLRLGRPRADIMRWLLPGLVLSDEEYQFSLAKTSSAIVVPGLQNQENDTEPESIGTAILYLSRHNLDTRVACELLAVLRNEDGGYLLSANKIRDAIGGNAATIKGYVAAMRPETQPVSTAAQGRWEFDDKGNMTKVR